MLDLNAQIANHEDELLRAEAGVDALESALRDRWYPAYHIAARAGWINDPNGLAYYNGRYHVFFQHHPYGTQWGPMHWGHVSSTDLVHWDREPIALAPSIEADRDGCWSGSCVTGDDGRLYAFYTGNRWLGDPSVDRAHLQVQCAAVCADGTRFQKLGVVVPNNEGLGNFRDPKVWRQGDVWCMIVGQQSHENRGQISLYTSSDLIAWDYAGILYQSPDPCVRMLECPDFFCLDGRWVLCFSAMGMQPDGYIARNHNNAGYVVGSWELGHPFEAHTDFRPLDWGHSYYAPQSFTAPDGRQVMFGWMSDFSFSIPSMADGWCGLLTLPRELSLRGDNVLLSNPVQEIDRLFEASHTLGNVALSANQELLIASDLRRGLLDLTYDLASTTAERTGLKIHQTGNGCHLYVAYDAQTGYVAADARCTELGNRGYRAVPVSGGTLRLRVYVDNSSIEVYVNDGEAVLSELSFPGDGPCSVVLTSESGTATINAVSYSSMCASQQ